MKLAQAICYLQSSDHSCMHWNLFIRKTVVWLILAFTTLTVIQANAQSLLKPGANNTGPLINESSLKAYTGPTTITKAGTVIEGVLIKGQINVEADNVVFRNFVIRTSAYYGIQSINGAKNLLIEDGLIEGMKSAAVYASNFTAKRLEIRNSGADGIKAESNFLIESNWIHQLGYISTSHADGVQMVQGKDGVIRGNYFDMIPGTDGFKNSQCLMISTNNGHITNIKIEKNWINGGGYSVQIRDKETSDYGVPTNMVVIANRFGRDHQFGVWKFDGNVFTDLNVWDDNGTLISGQKGTGSVISIDPTTPTSQASTPIVSPGGGAYLKPQLITMSSATTGSTIYFTTNGSTPTKLSTKYTAPILIDKTSEIKAIAFADGQEPSYTTYEAYEYGQFLTSEDWTNLSIDGKDKLFTVSAEITPNANAVDVVFGASKGSSEAYSHLAAIARFAPTGVVDARHGSIYKADQVFRYVSGQKYSLRVVIDPTGKTYSVFISGTAGDWITIAESYSFRTEQAATEVIDNIAFTAIGVGATIGSLTFGGAPVAPQSLKLQVL
jgi:hypothetical protein